jgi:hypothetical protein
VRIDWAVLCRYVETEGDTANILGAGVDTFWVPSFPTPIGVWVAVRMVGLPQDVEGGPHTFRCRVLDDDMMKEAAPPIEHTFTAKLAPAHLAGWEQGKINPVIVQFAATGVGTYTLELMLDGGNPVTVPVRVEQGPPPAG